jgi:hypothetical protein
METGGACRAVLATAARTVGTARPISVPLQPLMEIPMLNFKRPLAALALLLGLGLAFGLGACATTYPNEPMKPERLAQIRSVHEPRGWRYVPALDTRTHAHFIEPASIQREGSRVTHHILRIPAKPSFDGLGLGAMRIRYQVECGAQTWQQLSIEGFRDELATQPATRTEQAGPVLKWPSNPDLQGFLLRLCAG